MSYLTTCPVGASIADIPLSDCPVSLGQIQKVLFVRLNASAGVLNEFVIASANPELKATWTPGLAASDGTKIVQSPFISAPTGEAGEALTYGGGNETLDGEEIIIGSAHTPFTGKLLQAASITIESLKKLIGETLGVYLIDEHGRITGVVEDNTAKTKFRPIPIRSLFISDKTLGGFDAPDSYMISWSFRANWSDKLHTVTPSDFSALNDLVTP